MNSNQRHKTPAAVPDKPEGLSPWVITVDNRVIFSLGPYSDHGRMRPHTLLGSLVREFKYENIPLNRQRAIEQRILNAAIRVMRAVWPEQPFDLCAPVPSNRKNGPSLPTEFSRSLSERYPQIHNGRSAISKERIISSLKSVPKRARSSHIAGAYSFSPERFPAKGVLVVDDVYDTGATLREVDRAIDASAGPDEPKCARYFLVFSHLESNRKWKKWQEF